MKENQLVRREIYNSATESQAKILQGQNPSLYLREAKALAEVKLLNGTRDFATCLRKKGELRAAEVVFSEVSSRMKQILGGKSIYSGQSKLSQNG